MKILKSILSKKGKRGKRGKRRRRLGYALVAAYCLTSIGYYYLPWSIRQEVSDRVPTVDRALRATGFQFLQGWDELALVGRDADAPKKKSGRGDQAYGGFPSQGFKVFGRVNVLENLGYSVGYSESMKEPLWAAYRIFDVPKLESGKRESRFATDTRTHAKVSHDDYTHSGYDRGHMAPNYGIATRYGSKAQKETFLMSNIIPQTPSVNRQIWKNLELRIARKYGRFFGEVWVFTGPVFQGKVQKLPSGVPIPTAYYKIIVDEHEGKLRALAFLVPSEVQPFTRIKRYLVSIDELETLTDLDFFPDLPKSVQEELESKKATRLWPWLIPALKYYTTGETTE